MQNDYYRIMCRWMLLSGALFAASCTKENPAAKCSTGTCTDPAAPFCDVDGSIGGTPGMCLGVTCMPGDFAACRGDVALTCNANGNNYDELLCQKGCTPDAMGCKLCDPGQTLCTNGEVQTCDENGAVTASETCALGCFDDEPRCRELDPSNGFASYVDMVTGPPDIDVTASGSFDTGTGTLKIGSMSVAVPNFFVTAPMGGSAVRVFVVHDFRLAQSASVYVVDSTSIDGFTGTALAIVATGTITIDGELDVGGTAGSHADPACTGHPGNETDNGTQGMRVQAGASGGGGFATAGGPGLGMDNGVSGGAGGGTIGTGTLVPLRGGCPAGGVNTDNADTPYGTPAGGAVQLSAGVTLIVNGTINVDGGTGFPDEGPGYLAVFGGGSGGAVLLEAPTVTLGPNALLLARGGGGGSSNVPSSYPLDSNPIPGVPCAVQSAYCGGGGNGAASGTDALPGMGAQYTTNPSITVMSGGGGGGGLGRIRINTQTGTYTKSSSSIEAGALTTGTVGTR